MRIALVSRELFPFETGGIGRYVASTARLLSAVGEVTVLTTSRWAAAYDALAAAGEVGGMPSTVRVAFVAEPTADDLVGWRHIMHLYSARVLETLREIYPEGGPDLIEFPDFLGEGFVTQQAAATHDPFLSGTRICVRTHTTSELCSVLDGHYPSDPSTQTLFALERYSLAQADRVLWQGGDILGTYHRYYDDAVGPAVQVPAPLPLMADDPGVDQRPAGPLRVLFAGRLERRKGIHNLVRAITGLRSDDIVLSILGRDTPTAPLGGSMRAALAQAADGDPRIRFADEAGADGVAAAIRAHDVIAIPSLWECWPYMALEALMLDRPILGTPVGGLSDIVRSDVSGWLAAGTGTTALNHLLRWAVDEREGIREVGESGRPRAHAHVVGSEAGILDAYASILSTPPVRARRRIGAQPPLVSAIVPYYGLPRFVTETVASLVAQTHPRIEIIIVNDGSFDDEDHVLADIVAEFPVRVITRANAGLGSARNLGVHCSGGQYFFPLDADNIAEPDFVARAVAALEADAHVAYVTSWSRYVDADGIPFRGGSEGYNPLGNFADLNAHVNVAGDAAAVIRRRLFDSGFRYDEELQSLEDWDLYRRLQQAGHLGAVIPERLIRYRVRDDSMQARITNPNYDRLLGEVGARQRESSITWTS